MPATMGGTTVTIFRNHESHKLHLEFVANEALVEGQPCKLLADGKVAHWAAADAAIPIIGWAVMSAAQNANITLAVRGYLVIYGKSNAPIPAAGLGKYAGVQDVDSEGHSIPLFAPAVDIATMQGWILNTAAGALSPVMFLAMD